ncbi:hypothetical protein ALC53_05205 [Atta colombica]|uniref:Uncharacterized protein n=1 Tax=Atta colombica TaxID=520822 RepID=A0A195BHW7_9HYME|nr:hypothetical protein ALC53_05205 [Atta colombica]
MESGKSESIPKQAMNVITITRFVPKMQFDVENVDIESCTRSVQKDVCFLILTFRVIQKYRKRSREDKREKISPATKAPASGAELLDGTRPMTPLGNDGGTRHHT